jgi:KipI family sensor histidine kinase inhibitor
MPVELHPLGDDALEARTGLGVRPLHAVAHTLRAQGRFEEVVPGMGCLAVRFDPLHLTPDKAAGLLKAALEASPAAEDAPGTEHVLPVRYDGPDLAAVAEMLDLTAAALTERHAALTHEVVLIGFTPGFAYLSGAEGLSVPRLASPRVRVPAGSVGLAGGRTGLYALAGPGGWPLIGRTEAALWRGDSPLLRPGDRVRFEPA